MTKIAVFFSVFKGLAISLRLRFAIAAGALIVFYLGLCLFLRFWQSRLLFFPPTAIATTPAEVNLSYKEVWLPVSTGKIHGWWIGSSQADAPALLYFHGNGSNIGDLINRASRFHQLGLSVLLIDYRGYGKSSGPFPNESLVYEDAQAALTYLTQTRQLPPQKIFLYGHSLGGAVAIELASRHPQLAGIIIEGSFTSVAAVAKEISLYRLFPIDWILTQKFDSINKISSLKMPMLFIHGTADEVVPSKMSQELYAAAPQPKQLLLIPEAGHNDVAKLGGIKYLQAIEQLIQPGRNSKRNKLKTEI
jgi:pimeloyl-ACP methyl ester carboxylesterase